MRERYFRSFSGKTMSSSVPNSRSSPADVIWYSRFFRFTILYSNGSFQGSEYASQARLYQFRSGAAGFPASVRFKWAGRARPKLQNASLTPVLRHVEPSDSREWISGGVAAAGFAVAAFGAWPRRRRESVP